MCERSKSEKINRTTEDILVVASDEEEKYRKENENKIKKYVEDEKNHKCTVCENIIVTSEFSHPALRVLICTECISNYDPSLFPRNSEGIDINCRWCAKQANKFNCSACTCTFCEQCITINFGENFTKNLEKNWTCFICNPSQLWFLRAICSQIMENKIERSKFLKDLKNTPNKLFPQKKLMRNRRAISIDSEKAKREEKKLNRTYSVNIEKDIQSVLNTEKSENFTKKDDASVNVTNLNIVKLEENQIEDIFSSLVDAQNQITNFIKSAQTELINYCSKKLVKENIKTKGDVDKIFNKITTFCNQSSENFKSYETQLIAEKNRFDSKYFNNEEINNYKRKYYQENGYLDQLMKTPSFENEIIEEAPKNTKKICLSTKKPSQTIEFDSQISDSQLIETVRNIEDSFSDLELLDIVEKIEVNNNKKLENESNLDKSWKITTKTESKVEQQHKITTIDVKIEELSQNTDKIVENIDLYDEDTLDFNDSSQTIDETLNLIENLETELTPKNSDNQISYFKSINEKSEEKSPIKNEKTSPEKITIKKESDIFNAGLNLQLKTSCTKDILSNESLHLKSEELNEEIHVKNEIDDDQMSNFSVDTLILNKKSDGKVEENIEKRIHQDFSEDEDLTQIQNVNNIEKPTEEIIINYSVDEKSNISEELTQNCSDTTVIYTNPEISDIKKENIPQVFDNQSDISNNSEEITQDDRENAYLALKYPSSSSAYISDESEFLNSSESSESKKSDDLEDNDKKINLKVAINLYESKKYVENWIKTHHSNNIDKEDQLIDRLTNLDNLKRNKTSNSDKSSEKSLKKRFKKIKKNSSLGSKSSVNTPSIDQSDSSDDDLLKTEKSPNFSQDSWIVLDDLDSTDNDEILEENDKNGEKCKKNKGKSKENSSDDENSKEKNWRDDPLLNQNLNLLDSDDDFKVFDEENDFEMEKNIQSHSKRPSTSYSEISSDSEDDVQFISETQGKFKRRNIRTVLSEESLTEATKLAAKIEKERKQRLTQHQQKIDTMLSQSSINQEETGYVLDIDEDKNPLVTIDAKLMNLLKPHQIKGIKFMWDICFESVKKTNSEPGTGCILAHCMGLGKTRQVVVLTHTLLINKNIKNFNHILVICPLSTVLNWKDEYKKTLNKSNHINIREITSSLSLTRKIDVVKSWYDTRGVLIIGYDAYKALLSTKRKTETQIELLKKALLDPGPQLIICDEGHMLKDGKSQRFKTISKIKTARRIILTGTPLQNNLHEYYHMVSFVKPNLLGTEQEYNNRFVNPILNGQYVNSSLDDIKLMRNRSHVLHKKLETTVQRFESSELEKYMPKRFDFILSIQLSELQKELYQHYLKSLDETGKTKLFIDYHNLSYIWTHPALLQYRLEKKGKTKKTYEEYIPEEIDLDKIQNQIDLHWFKNLVPDDFLTNIKYSPKMEILFAILEECVRIGDKLLVFSSSTIELDLIEHFLSQNKVIRWKNKWNYYRIDGTVDPDSRMKFCNDFNNENNKLPKLFLISYKVGGLGLNLFAANRVVLMDVCWNPTYDLQSIYRSYRFGQKKNVYIYRLVSMGTMEEVVCSRGITKLAISRRVVDEQQISRHFKSDDLQKMYNLETEYGERPTPKLPDDRLLANLLTKFNPILYKYCEHQKLLENLPHEELNDEDRKKAWEEFENEETLAKIAKNNQLLMDLSVNTTHNNVPNYQNQPSTSYGYYSTSNYPYPQYTYALPYYNPNIPNLSSNNVNIPTSTTVNNSVQIPHTYKNIRKENQNNTNIPITETINNIYKNINKLNSYLPPSNINIPSTSTRDINNLNNVQNPQIYKNIPKENPYISTNNINIPSTSTRDINNVNNVQNSHIYKNIPKENPYISTNNINIPSTSTRDINNLNNVQNPQIYKNIPKENPYISTNNINIPLTSIRETVNNLSNAQNPHLYKKIPKENPYISTNNINKPSTSTTENINVNNVTNPQIYKNKPKENHNLIRIPLNSTINKNLIELSLEKDKQNLNTPLNLKINDKNIENQNGVPNKGNIIDIPTDFSTTNKKNSELQKIDDSNSTEKPTPSKTKPDTPSKDNKIKENKSPNRKIRQHNLKNYRQNYEMSNFNHKRNFNSDFRRFPKKRRLFRGNRGFFNNNEYNRGNLARRFEFDNYNRDFNDDIDMNYNRDMYEFERNERYAQNDDRRYFYGDEANFRGNVNPDFDYYDDYYE